MQVDFGNRSQNQTVIPANFIAAQRGAFGANEPEALGLLKQNGVGVIRLDARLEEVYATRTPNWANLDAALGNLKNAGMQAILELDFTPPWLEPNPNPCLVNGQATGAVLPADFQTWANLAAASVHHVDVNFPGLVLGYEIWNEPDNSIFNCAPPDGQSRMNAYYQFYAVVGATLRAQANVDGTHIRIGGPALTGVTESTLPYLLQFVNNPSTAPYIDFVSYHEYLIGAVPALTWLGPDPSESVFYAITNSTNGLEAQYAQAANSVRGGLQPNASTTPIYITEYNTTWDVAAVDCCRNSATYAPLFNATVITTLLNGRSFPAGISYYSAYDGVDEMCLLAGAGTDCQYQGGPLVVLPQLQTFNLIGGAGYLDLESGGFLASQASATDSNLLTTAFYTQKGDAVLVVNTSPTASPQVTLNFDNVGLAQASAAVFLLNDQNSAISTQPLALTQTQTGYTGQISIPGYSVVGISLQ